MKKEINEILNPLVNTYTLNEERTQVIDQLQALIDRAVRSERERILKRITPALDDFSNAGQTMIKDGRFVNSGNEMLENVGFIKGEFLSHLTDSEK